MEDWISLSASSCDLAESLISEQNYSESSLSDNESKKYYINGEYVELCKLLEQIDLAEVLTVDVWSDLVSDKDKQDLIKYLPDTRVNQTLEELFTHQIFHISNPIQEFSDKFKRGMFTKAHSKKTQKLRANWDDFLYKYTTGLGEELPLAIQNLNYPQLLQGKLRKQLVYHTFSSDTSSDESIFSTGFENCSSGESTVLDEEEEAIHEINERSKRGEDEEKEIELKKAGNIDWVKFSSRFKDLNIHKNQLTVRMPSMDWVENYRRQETDRYKNPTFPWAFQLEEGTTVVAPVNKKITSSNIKPRDHQCLKPDRPGYLTLLSLTRDAAARLPDGVGTRADICQLVRDSQFIVETASDTQISNLISGALDRLHYEKDPCVKYDTERKLWMYLHKGRGLDYYTWKSELPVKRGRPSVNLVPENISKDYWPPYLEEEILLKKKKK